MMPTHPNHNHAEQPAERAFDQTRRDVLELAQRPEGGVCPDGARLLDHKLTQRGDEMTFHAKPPKQTMMPVLPTYAAPDLTEGGDQAHIVLNDQVYTLRITRAGKLILTK